MNDVVRPNCCATLRSYIPNVVQKAAWYHDFAIAYVLNTNKVCATLMVTTYPVEPQQRPLVKDVEFSRLRSHLDGCAGVDFKYGEHTMA